MITKTALENIVSKQRKMLANVSPGHPREIEESIPYLTDRMLLIGGVRGCGCSALLHRMLNNDYPEAWYTDFDDPRLGGFDAGDFTKLDRLLEESGKGIAMFNRIDLAAGWIEFCDRKIRQGIKIVSTVSLETLLRLAKAERPDGTGAVPDIFSLRRLDLFSYNEFLSFTHKPAGEQAVNEFLSRGAFPGLIKTGHTEALHQLYTEILCKDAVIAGGIRDRNTLQRMALHLITNTGEPVTANKLREKLKIKAVSTAAEHMQCIETAGLVRFVSILSDNPARQAVNPRKVYAVDTALAAAVSTAETVDRNKLFETMLFNHLCRESRSVCYTNEQGGCDFIASDAEGGVRCIQACYDDDPDLMQTKTDGLLWALRQTGSSRGTIVTADRNDRIDAENFEIEVIDADTFLGGY